MAHDLLRDTIAPDYLDRTVHLALAWAAAERGPLVLAGAREWGTTA